MRVQNIFKMIDRGMAKTSYLNVRQNFLPRFHLEKHKRKSLDFPDAGVSDNTFANLLFPGSGDVHSTRTILL